MARGVDLASIEAPPPTYQQVSIPADYVPPTNPQPIQSSRSQNRAARETDIQDHQGAFQEVAFVTEFYAAVVQRHLQHKLGIPVKTGFAAKGSNLCYIDGYVEDDAGIEWSADRKDPTRKGS